MLYTFSALDFLIYSKQTSGSAALEWLDTIASLDRTFIDFGLSKGSLTRLLNKPWLVGLIPNAVLQYLILPRQVEEQDV